MPLSGQKNKGKLTDQKYHLKNFLLHTGKTNLCKIIIFTKKKIQKWTNIRDLCVIIDSKLRFTDHIGKNQKRLYKKSSNIKNNENKYISYFNTGLQIIRQIIMRIIWNPIQNKDITKIEKFKNFLHVWHLRNVVQFIKI